MKYLNDNLHVSIQEIPTGTEPLVEYPILVVPLKQEADGLVAQQTRECSGGRQLLVIGHDDVTVAINRRV